MELILISFNIVINLIYGTTLSLRASATERQTCVCRRSIAPAERQFFRHLFAGEQCDANIGVALFTYAIFFVSTGFAEETRQRRLPPPKPKNGVRMAFDWR
ncbi:hypothetical protein M5K25_019714 [Dendrobium thyrsiflorum]|uniref:Secreted protein n=1 Tax=Dendrobium thyrsiflorum TaxID=117978 RepID=A0ABD0UFR5_DENTH